MAAVALRAGWRAAQTVLGAYAQILIARSLPTGFLLLVATALDLPALLAGLAALAGAGLVARTMSLPGRTLEDGPAGYNALFTGLAVGHLFGATPGLLGLAAAGGGICLLATCAFAATAGKTLGLPALTVPFLIVTDLLVLSAPALGIRFRAAPLVAAHSAPAAVLTWIGALVFVPRVEAGLLVVVALLVHSRIAFLLGAAGALALLPLLRHVELAPGTAAPMLFNGVLAAMALGGTWFVPGPASFLLAAVGAVLCGLATVALQRLVGPWGLPLMVLPFNLVVLTLLCAMRQRGRDRFPSAVGFAPGSPERNLRFHQTRILRAQAGKEAGGGVAFGLPFRGAWICTQGIDGPHTHQGPWRHAFDFEVAGQDGWLQVPGGADRDPSRYHCYGLPVLAAADGTVVRVEEDVPDNAVGAVNLERNWGNVVVLVHAPGVYSLVAHLAPGSAAVREGQVVRRGEVVGLCGNSGRSPRPHLHFQLQATPVLGAPTLPCAFESGVLTGASPARLLAGFVPREGETWKNPEPFPELAEQLVFAPGTSAVYRVNQRVERIASEIDLFGQPLLRSDRGGVLTFARTAAQFTVLDVEGPADSALVLLRAALGRVPLAADPSACWHDQLPPAFGAGRTWRWLREILAPFLPGQGLPIEYRCLHEGGRLAIEGRSLRADAQGAPAAFSRARLAPGGWPDVVELSLACGPCARAERIPQPAAPAPRTRSSVAERRRAVAIPPLPPPLSRVIPLSDRIRARRFDDREA